MKNQKKNLIKHIDTGKKNIMFFLLVFVMIFCTFLWGKRTDLEIEIISSPDDFIELTGENEYMEQTWAPNVKMLKGIKVPFVAEDSFTGVLEARIFSDKYEEIRNSRITYDFVQGNSGELIFEFEDIKVDVGARYRFQIRFLEESEDGRIKISAKEDSAGVSIDGKEIDKTVALKIVAEKNSRIFWLISSFFPFLAFALFLSVFYKRKVEETIGFSFIMLIMLLFVFGLFEQLQFGIAVIGVVGIVCFAGTFVLCHKKNLNIFEWVTPGLSIYGGIMAYMILVCHDLFRREWDEYNHWGLAVKDMFYYDAFSKHIDSSVWLQRYPPFSTLVEYFFTYHNEMFSEGILYVAYLAFLFSLLIMVFHKCKWREISQLAAAGIAITLLPMVFFDHFYFIYVDLLLGVLFAYILICYYSEDMSGFNILRICAGLMALVLTKDMGLVLAGLFVIVAAMEQLYNMIKEKAQRKFKKLIPVGIMGMAALLPFVIWQIYIAIPAKSVSVIAEETGEVIEKVGKSSSTIEASGLSLQGVIELITMQAPEYKYQIIKDYFKILFTEGTFAIGNLELSYILILFVAVIGLVYLYRKEKSSKFIRLIFASILVSMGYLMFLLVMYLFAFPLSDALVLHSHRRYFASCIGGSVIGIVGILLLDSKRNTNTYKNFIYAGCAALLVGVPIGHLYPENLDTYITAEKIAGYDEIEKITRCFADKSESVYYVYNNSRNGALEQIIFRNYASPVASNGGTFFASKEAREKEEQLLELNGETEDTLVSKKLKTLEEWQEELKEYDYLFLHRPGYVFEEYYGSLFEDPATIDDKTYYKVEKTGDTVELQYMGKVQ